VKSLKQNKKAGKKNHTTEMRCVIAQDLRRMETDI
jgi:hypothetical protein